MRAALWAILTRCAPAALAVFLATAPASAACIMSYCKDRAATSRHNITDTDRRIIGYIERNGTVTNTSRQPVAGIELD